MMRPMVLQFVPSPPILVAAVAGNASATVSFTNSYTGGSPVTSYTVTSIPDGITATGTHSPIVVNGLTNGTAYMFTVTATNAVGTSPASLPSNTVTPATVPGAPVIGTAVGGNAQATVNFSPPATNGGSPVLSYTATSTPGSFTKTGPASPLIVTGLGNGVPYTFRVTATNAIGTGVPSAASNSVTPKTTLAGPSNLQATAIATNYVTLSWTNNANNQTGFLVWRSNNGGQTWSQVGGTPTTTATTYRVLNLTTQTRYLFRVQAYTSSGPTVSAFSNILSVTTR